jgi:hypothetical protein
VPPAIIGAGKSHEAQISVIISHAHSQRFSSKVASARGETGEGFAMSQLSGIVSLFLIAAAFLTSCGDQQSRQNSPPLAALHSSE